MNRKHIEEKTQNKDGLSMMETELQNAINESDTLQDCIDDLIFSLMEERKKQRLTQTQLSILSGIPQSTISRMESLAITPTLNVVFRLCMALNVDFGIIHKNKDNSCKISDESAHSQEGNTSSMSLDSPHVPSKNTCKSQQSSMRTGSAPRLRLYQLRRRVKSRS